MVGWVWRWWWWLVAGLIWACQVGMTRSRVWLSIRKFLSFASALSSCVRVRAWTDGQQVSAEYVDGLAIGPARTLGTDQRGDGYHVTFEMDDEWRPLGAMDDF